MGGGGGGGGGGGVHSIRDHLYMISDSILPYSGNSVYVSVPFV